MWIWIILGIIVLALLGSCMDSDSGPDGTYTPEECVALQLSGNSGDSHSAAEWAVHCQ
jgi:hypothetical protein